MADSGTARPLRVFLCHASADKPAVRELYRRLCADGIDAWLDEENLLPGQDWQLEIPKAVRQSDVVLVCLSPRSINKEGYVQKEIRFALDVADEKPEGTIFLIPLRLEDCAVPERLGRWQWVNLFSQNGYARLMRALQVRATGLGLGVAPTHVALPAKHSIEIRKFGGMEFVRVPAGKFLMGSKDDDPLASDDEKPQHTIEIPYDYWMARYPVTNEQFAKFVRAAAYKFDLYSNWKKKADHPVAGVAWHDATAFFKWLNEQLRSDLGKLVLRLPTEAEWEKAARGTDGRIYPWGNEFDKNKCNSGEGSKGDTTPVGAYSPQGDSLYGCADMAGNVWEWVHSLSKKYPYNPRDGRENAASTAYRVLRGGAFSSSERVVRCAYRNWNNPNLRLRLSGFRLVVSPFDSGL